MPVAVMGAVALGRSLGGGRVPKHIVTEHMHRQQIGDGGLPLTDGGHVPAQRGHIQTDHPRVAQVEPGRIGQHRPFAGGRRDRAAEPLHRRFRRRLQPHRGPVQMGDLRFLGHHDQIAEQGHRITLRPDRGGDITDVKQRIHHLPPGRPLRQDNTVAFKRGGDGGVLVDAVQLRRLIVAVMRVGTIQRQARRFRQTLRGRRRARRRRQHAEQGHQKGPLLGRGDPQAQGGIQRVDRPLHPVLRCVELRLVVPCGRQGIPHQRNQALRGRPDVDDPHKGQLPKTGTQDQRQIIERHRHRFARAGAGEIQLVPGALQRGPRLVRKQLAVAGAVNHRSGRPRRGGPKQRQGSNHLAQWRRVAGGDVKLTQARHGRDPGFDGMAGHLAHRATAPGLHMRGQMRRARAQRLRVGPAVGR